MWSQRRDGPPLSAKCISKKDITIYLPHDFRGSIRSCTATGDVILSKEVHRNSIFVSQDGLHSVYYVGVTPGPDDTLDDSDELELAAMEGWIKFALHRRDAI